MLPCLSLNSSKEEQPSTCSSVDLLVTDRCTNITVKNEPTSNQKLFGSGQVNHFFFKNDHLK